jgi:molybdopterin converting factor small subunit
VKVRVFAGLRDKFGEEIEVPIAAPCTAEDVERALVAMSCWLPGTRLAIDHRFALADDEVGVASEVAVIPPVTGG